VTVAGDLAPVTRDLADELTGPIVEDMLNAASFAIKRDALDVAGRVTGGDRRLSRFGGRSRGRVRMGVGYDIEGSRSTVKLRPVALWALTTQGARPHVIGAGRRARSGRYTKRRRAVVLKFPVAVNGSRLRTAPVRHPGTRGRGALARVYAAVPGHVEAAFADVMADRGFR
jgi:hypothetical protein